MSDKLQWVGAWISFACGVVAISLTQSFHPGWHAKLPGTSRVGEMDLAHPHLQDEDEVKTPLDVDCITHCRNNAVESRFTWTQRDDSLRSCWAKKITTTQHVQTAWCRFPVLFVEGPICISVRFQRPEFCEGNLLLALWRLWTFQTNSKLTAPVVCKCPISFFRCWSPASVGCSNLHHQICWSDCYC